MLNDSHPIQKHAMYQVTYLCDLHVQSTGHEFIINYFVKFCQLIFHCPKQTKSWPSLAFGEQYPLPMNLSTYDIYIYIYDILYIYIYISYWLHTYSQSVLPHKSSSSALWGTKLCAEASDKTCHLETQWHWMLMETKKQHWMIWWFVIEDLESTAFFLQDLFNIFLLGQKRWWTEKPTLGFKMINGGST